MTADGSGSPQVAPPPPPPEAYQPDPQAGFRLSQRRAVLEVLLALGAVALVVLLLSTLLGRIAAWAVPLVPLDVDRRLGEMGRAQVESVQTPCEGPQQAYVEQLGTRLTSALDQRPFAFQFRVVASPEVNAFALPGGFVMINTGLLDQARSGEEIAAVLAHEIQHAVLRHGTRRMLRQMGSGMVLGLLFGGSDLDQVAALSGQLTALSFDRAEEAEADRLGAELLVRAQIDPGGLSSFFLRLAEENPARPPEFLSTHPDPGNRSRLALATAASVASLRPGAFVALAPVPKGDCGP